MQQTEPTEKEGVRSAVGNAAEVQGSSEGRTTDEGRFKGGAKEKSDSPWNKVQRGNPGEDWQPQSWSPGAAARR